MNIGKTKLSGTTAILLISLLAVSTVLGMTILYTLTVPATWKVNVAYGLELDYTNGTKVTTLSFTVAQLSAQTQSFILKNIGNHAVNVTDNIPASTSLYTFTTTFLNSTTIAKGGSYAFTITLTDLGMDSSVTYSGAFAYNIVSGFSAGSSTFSTTSVNYASDSAQYFGFVSDSFNASNYPIGSTVLYSFVTRNINATLEIQGLSYKLEVYDASNNLVNTICDGLMVAYWQDSTHHGTYGNGTHMTDKPLMPNKTITIWNSFTAPSSAGTYHLVLTYQSHNAAPIAISWTVSIVNPWSVGIQISTPVISGASQCGQAGTVSFTITNQYSGPITFDYNVIVLDSSGNLIVTIASGSDSLGADISNNKKSYNFDIPALTIGGSLTLKIAISNLGT